MTKIIKLEASNFKVLKAVEITPEGNLVVISGRNGQGKSSILDAITAALGGVSAKTTPRPIRDGESNAQIVLETEDLIVTRKFTASGSTLTVKSPDGATYSKGQAKLDDLLGKLSLDPLAFTQLSDRDQLATLLDLVNLPFDPAKIDAERKEVFDRRAEVGKKGKAIGEVKADKSLPTKETSASEIIGKIREAEKSKRDRDEHESGVQLAAEKVKSIREQIAALTTELETWSTTVSTRTTAQNELPAVVDTAQLEAQLASVEETNAAIRSNNDAIAKVAEQAEYRAEYKTLTEELATIDAFKAEGLAAATFPVEGVAFDEGGVTYQGVPFKQASSAEQLRVSLAMAIALNPALRVIRIADGSLLDADNLKLIEAMAVENDYQVWIEMVSDTGDFGVVIEDGQVA